MAFWHFCAEHFPGIAKTITTFSKQVLLLFWKFPYCISITPVNLQKKKKALSNRKSKLIFTSCRLLYAINNKPRKINIFICLVTKCYIHMYVLDIYVLNKHTWTRGKDIFIYTKLVIYSNSLDTFFFLFGVIML